MGKLGIALPVIVGIFILMSVESHDAFAYPTTVVVSPYSGGGFTIQASDTDGIDTLIFEGNGGYHFESPLNYSNCLDSLGLAENPLTSFPGIFVVKDCTGDITFWDVTTTGAIQNFNSPPDMDFDGVSNNADNCQTTSNPTQEDSDGDGEGDACDENPSLVCGPGTITWGVQCIPTGEPITCASGTTLNTSTNQCEPDPVPQTTCGVGTMLDATANECVPDSAAEEPTGSNTITITTRDPSSIFGERIDIDGLVNGATDRVDVNIKILDPSGVIVKENDERTNPNGEFDTSASSGTTNNWVLSGTYAVEVTSDTLSGQTTFSFAGTDSEFGFGGTLSETIPPVQQMKSGISPADVECRFGLEPIQKPTGSVACVRSSSIEKLLDIGWNLVQ